MLDPVQYQRMMIRVSASFETTVALCHYVDVLWSSFSDSTYAFFPLHVVSSDSQLQQESVAATHSDKSDTSSVR